jgi:hypothetical protein
VRLRSIEAIDEFAEEFEDRFGAPPDEVPFLIELARLAERCRALAVAKIDAGPQAIALTFRDGAATPGLEGADERLCWRRAPGFRATDRACRSAPARGKPAVAPIVSSAPPLTSGQAASGHVRKQRATLSAVQAPRGIGRCCGTSGE